MATVSQMNLWTENRGFCDQSAYTDTQSLNTLTHSLTHSHTHTHTQPSCIKACWSCIRACCLSFVHQRKPEKEKISTPGPLNGIIPLWQLTLHPSSHHYDPY